MSRLKKIIEVNCVKKFPFSSCNGDGGVHSFNKKNLEASRYGIITIKVQI